MPSTTTINSDSLLATEALAALCRAYWFPLYAYVRRQGYAVPDAQDLTDNSDLSADRVLDTIHQRGDPLRLLQETRTLAGQCGPDGG